MSARFKIGPHRRATLVLVAPGTTADLEVLREFGEEQREVSNPLSALEIEQAGPDRWVLSWRADGPHEVEDERAALLDDGEDQG